LCGPWFYPIVAALFGSYDPSANQRHISEVFQLIPKGNSKSSNGGAVMVTAIIYTRRIVVRGIVRPCRHHPFCSLMWAERYDIVDYVSQIKSPKLIVHGGRDKVLPVESERRLYDEASEPKEFVKIEECGHADLSRFAYPGNS
jgi:pimeloyl-ACP methyl ester carboxylesterase